MTDQINTFIESSRFAKVVTTADGPAINIDGEIINIRSADPAFHVDALTRALRSPGERSGAGEATSQATS